MLFSKKSEIEDVLYGLNITDAELEMFKDMDEEELTEYIDILSRELSIDDLYFYKSTITILLCSLMGLRSRNSNKWHTFTGIAAIGLIANKLMNRCLYTPFLEYFGLRTNHEIMSEMVILQYLRGDFDVIDDDLLDEFSEEYDDYGDEDYAEEFAQEYSGSLGRS